MVVMTMTTRWERPGSGSGKDPSQGLEGPGHEACPASMASMASMASKAARGARHVIRCYVNQRLSPMRVVKEMAALGMLDSPACQRWFVARCFEFDAVVCSSQRTLGDAVYFKNLLYRLAKELSRDGRVMEDAVAEAMGRANDLAASLEEAGASSGDWLRKSYMYGRAGDGNGGREGGSEGGAGDEVEAYGVVHIGSHVNMFAGSTGCFEWDAGYLLCEFVLNNVSLFQGRTVVDIGCGTGMATIVLAQLRRSGVLACGPIVCSDGDAGTVDNCLANLRANGVEAEVAWCGTWRWEDGYVEGIGAHRRSIIENGSPVTMVGADLLYDPEIIPTIVPLLEEFLGQVHADSCVYLSTRRRSEETLAMFLEAVDATPALVLEDVSDAFWEAAAGDPSFVSFQHVPSLESAKAQRSVILHRISLDRS